MLICWTCLHTSEVDRSSQLGHHNAPWSSLRLRMIQRIDLMEVNRRDLRALSLKIWQDNETQFIVGTNAGFVVKGTVSPQEIQPIFQLHFLASHPWMVSNVSSVDVNCSQELYVVSHLSRKQPMNWFASIFHVGRSAVFYVICLVFLKACTLTQFHVVYLKRSKVICTLPCERTPIKVLWSQYRSSLFYIGNSSQIVVYDLLKSDMYPIATLPFRGIMDFDVLSVDSIEYLVGSLQMI